MPEISIPRNRLNLPETIWWENDSLYFLDQTQLPLQLAAAHQTDVQTVYDSIQALKVRGAPAIGIAGAYGLMVGLQAHRQASATEFLQEAETLASWLGEARPTAVNLKWALQRMLRFARQQEVDDAQVLHEHMLAEARRIHDEDRELCRNIGLHGLSLIKDGMGILTHCNAGSLATAEFGTATSPLYLAHQQGLAIKVFADETRPLLQGARLTSWELQQAGIDVTLITDSTAAHAMSQGMINMVIVGTDRVTANGDVANKIGTLSVALAAKHFGIPFYVALPYSTIDFRLASGSEIPIEQRSATEVTHFGQRRTAPEGIQVFSPAFDVTPHELVAGFITERGILLPPYQATLQSLQDASV